MYQPTTGGMLSGMGGGDGTVSVMFGMSLYFGN